MNLWPIQSFVVELPPELGYCFSSTLVCGLPCSPIKRSEKYSNRSFWPSFQSPRFPSADCRKKDFPAWKSWWSGCQGSIFIFLQFNGINRCSICLHSGERVQQGKSSIWIYPYSNQASARQTHARTAERQGKKCLVSKAFHLYCMCFMFQVKSFSITCIFFLQENSSGESTYGWTTRVKMDIWLNQCKRLIRQW